MDEVLGVDIGGVIIQSPRKGSTGPDTMFFTDRFLETPAVPGAFEALARLTQRFGARIHLVSKAQPATQERTRLWLEHHHFHLLTGIYVSHVEFCLERKDKAGICERLGVTHFVDDKLEVLSYLPTVPNRFLFCPRSEEVIKHIAHLGQVSMAMSWQQMLGFLAI